MSTPFSQIESMLEALQSSAPAEVTEQVRAILAALLEAHDAGLERILELGGPELGETLAADPAVAPLLLLHDRHPHGPRRRILEAIAADRRLATIAVRDCRIDGNRAELALESGDDAARAAAREIALAAAPEIESVEVEVAAGLIPARRLSRSLGEELA